MSRVVYISGFGVGKKAGEGVAKALTDHCGYADVDLYSFLEAMDDPNKIRRAVKGVDVVTHSAGMLAIVGTAPCRINSFGAPLPSSKLALIGTGLVKTPLLHAFGMRIHDLSALNVYASMAAGLTLHPEHFGNLGKIARFDAVACAIAAQKEKIATQLLYNKDEFFKLTNVARVAAEAAGVTVVTDIPGNHNELIFRPAQTLQYAYPATKTPEQPTALQVAPGTVLAPQSTL